MENTYCVYKISCKDPEVPEHYFGSTSNTYSRFANHKHCVKNYKSTKHHYKLYQHIRDRGGWNNWKCEIVDEGLAKDDARNLEKEYVLNNEYSLNEIVPARTNKEWRLANAEKVKAYAKKTYRKKPEYWQNYYQKRRDEYLEKIECECGSEVSRIHFKQHCRTKKHQEYLEKNKE